MRTLKIVEPEDLAGIRSAADKLIKEIDQVMAIKVTRFVDKDTNKQSTEPRFRRHNTYFLKGSRPTIETKQQVVEALSELQKHMSAGQIGKRIGFAGAGTLAKIIQKQTMSGRSARAILELKKEIVGQ